MLSNTKKMTMVIAEIGRMFVSKSDIDILLKDILALLSREYHIIRGMITLYRRDADEIIADISYGYTPDEIKKGIYKPGEGVTGQVLGTGEPVIIPWVKESPKFLNRTGARDWSDEKIAFLCVPVQAEERTIGTISVDILNNTNEAHFNEEMQILTLVSAMVAHAVTIRQEQRDREEALSEENRTLRERLAGRRSARIMIGTSPGIEAVYELIEQVAQTDVTVLITGESGTGKELVAEEIHRASARKEGPFIKFNIASLPSELIESELFGHEKGAFTGAVKLKKGRFERAVGGSIFIDEIGDLAPGLQVNLLRVLQDRAIERIGGTELIPVDARVIAATHQNIEEKIKKGEFREDLYYRLNIFPIHLPPLRERKIDIEPLVFFFLDIFNMKYSKEITRIDPDAREALYLYDWPGNIRELQNYVERAVILSRDNEIGPEHLPPALISLQRKEAPSSEKGASFEALLDGYAKAILIDTLKKTHGNVSEAARLLNTSKRVLSYKISKVGIDISEYKK